MKKILAAVVLMLLCSSKIVEAQAVSVTAVTKNASIIITAGNTYQIALSVLIPGQARRSLTIQNNNYSGTDGCWLQFGVGVTAANATKARSVYLAVGQAFTRYFPYVPSDEIEATCATSSDTLYIDIQ